MSCHSTLRLYQISPKIRATDRIRPEIFLRACRPSPAVALASIRPAESLSTNENTYLQIWKTLIRGPIMRALLSIGHLNLCKSSCLTSFSRCTPSTRMIFQIPQQPSELWTVCGLPACRSAPHRISRNSGSPAAPNATITVVMLTATETPSATATRVTYRLIPTSRLKPSPNTATYFSYRNSARHMNFALTIKRNRRSICRRKCCDY